MQGWIDFDKLFNEERTQLLEEGADPAAVDRAMGEAVRRLKEGDSEQAVWAARTDLPRRSDWKFNEPSDLAGIRALRDRAPSLPAFNPSDEVLFDKQYGAWLGRCVGCALGKPVELFMGPHNGLRSWQRQKEYLSAISPDEWPLRDYFPQHSPAEEKTGKVNCPASTREEIAYMESDDDIRYTVLGQMILHNFGRDFTTADVARTWLRYIPFLQAWTAEEVAYRNLTTAANHLRMWNQSRDTAKEADEAIDWQFVANHLNPYREWIGAQIRIDSYGYAAAGSPELAAEFAWRDARVSHIKNGIYGAMFCAAMIAAAFTTDDVKTIIEAGLAQIPKTSRLHAEMRQTIDICQRHGNDFAKFEAVFDEIYDLLEHYHPVHTNNNAALCVAALLLSGGDFAKAITLAVMGGLDTDCNGATVGSIVGAICGAKRVPQHWVGRFHDTLKSEVVDYHPIAISECAKRSVDIWKRIHPSK